MLVRAEPRRFRQALAALFVLALVTRLLFMLATPRHYYAGDSEDYHALARGLLEGKGYVHPVTGALYAIRSPGYPLLVAGVYSLLGQGETPIKLLQVVVDSFSCLLVAVIAARLFTRREGVLAGALYAGSAAHMAATVLLMAETIASFGILVVAWLLLVAKQRAQGWRWFVVGLVLGVVLLVKGQFVFCPPLFALLLYHWSGRKLRATLPRVGWLLLGTMLALTPWTLRNYAAFHRFVPIANQGGEVFYSAINPRQGKLQGFYVKDETALRIHQLPEAEQSDAFRRAAIDHVLHHPVAALRVTLLKYVFLFSPIDWELLPNAQIGAAGLLNPSYAFVAPFFLIGVVIAIKRRDDRAWLPLALVVNLLVMTLAVHGGPRMRLPSESFFVVLASYGLCRLAALDLRRLLIASGVYASLLVCAFVSSVELRAGARAVLHSAGLW